MDGSYLIDERTLFPEGTIIVFSPPTHVLWGRRVWPKNKGTKETAGSWMIPILEYQLPSKDPDLPNPFRKVEYPTFVLDRELRGRYVTTEVPAQKREAPRI